jgi:hypothetical protein
MRLEGRISEGGGTVSETVSSGATAPQPPNNDPTVKESFFEGTKAISLAGLVLIYLTAIIFSIICFMLFIRPYFVELTGGYTLERYIPEVILFIVGCFSAFLGVNLVRTAGLSTTVPKYVINPAEWNVISDEIKEGKEDAITQYIRLTSLTGLTGFFTKLGLQGLLASHYSIDNSIFIIIS